MSPKSHSKTLTGLKKRQQIQHASRAMFLWIAIASVVVSLAFVTAQFLFRQATFNQKIINAKSETQRTLSANLDNAEALKSQVDALLADQNLAKVKANPNDSNLKVVLDALPTSGDKAAIASSLQLAILSRSDVSISELAIDDQSVSDESEGGDTTTGSESNQIDFSFQATGSYEQITNMLRDLERSIRPMDITELGFQGTDNTLHVNVTGVTYFVPERTVNLGSKTISP